MIKGADGALQSQTHLRQTLHNSTGLSYAGMTAPGNRANGPGLGPPTEEADMTKANKFISSEEAEQILEAGDQFSVFERKLARSIAEAERRGAVRMLRDFAEVVGRADGDDKNLDATTLERIRWTAIDTADAIENGADL